MVKLEDIRYLIIPELYKFLKDLETGEGADISELEDAIAGLTTAIGDSESGIVKDIADIESAIGDESTEGTILARIKALEDADTVQQEVEGN